MTVLLLIVAAAAAALGTRVSVVPLLAAAALGGRGHVLPAVTTSVAAVGIGLMMLRSPPRRLAIPILGAAAALAAGSPNNAAVVPGLWVVATGAAVLTRPDGVEGRRWALSLCIADLPFIGAVLWTALDQGFEGWPSRLHGPGAALLLAAAAVRAPLASGASDDAFDTGLLVVRTQTVVAVVLALSGRQLPPWLVAAAVLGGAVAFAVGGAAQRAVTRDVIQEVGLLTVVLAAAQAGWGPGGWEWGALSAGTLIHYLRLRVQDDVLGRLAGLLHTSAGIGLPFLPVVVAGLEGSVGVGGWRATVVVVGLIVGLAARSQAPDSRPVDHSSSRWRLVAGVGIVGASLGVALWAPLLTWHRASAPDPISWPPVWAAGVVAVAALIGARFGRVLHPLVPDEAPPSRRRLPEARLPARWAGQRAVTVALGVLGLLAAATWALGVTRGFL